MGQWPNGHWATGMHPPWFIDSTFFLCLSVRAAGTPGRPRKVSSTSGTRDGYQFPKMTTCSTCSTCITQYGKHQNVQGQERPCMIPATWRRNMQNPWLLQGHRKPGYCSQRPWPGMIKPFLKPIRTEVLKEGQEVRKSHGRLIPCVCCKLHHPWEPLSVSAWAPWQHAEGFTLKSVFLLGSSTSPSYRWLLPGRWSRHAAALTPGRHKSVGIAEAT